MKFGQWETQGRLPGLLFTGPKDGETPAMVAPTEDSRNLTIAGGNHRLAVARAKRVTAVPVFFRAEDEKAVFEILGL
jgi:hypothetical protein